MNAYDLLDTQRALRKRLLDDGSAIRWRQARDLAAEMLLHLDDPESCWILATRWLQSELNADRVTGGRSDEFRSFYTPDYEAIRPDRPLQSLIGTRVNLSDPLVQRVFRSEQTVVFTNIREQDHFQPEPGDAQLTLPEIRIKMAVSVRDDGRRVGVVCAHWLDRRPRVSGECGRLLTEIGTTIVGPILAAADRLAAEALPSAAAPSGPWHGRCRLELLLTPAELRLAHLAATGMTYKEIARHLNRSFSTVDHHLRSIREKLGVNSAPRLATLLSSELRSHRH